MLATEEFFKKKQSASSGSNGAGSSGMATDEFFKKKQQEKSITKQPETSVQPPTESVDINLDEMKKGVVLPSFGVSQPNTAYSGQGTTSMGQGVKIDQTAFRTEQKKRDEEIRTKQNELIKNAQAGGQIYIEKLKPDEKELLISGLERKKAEQPVLRAATENDLSLEDYTQSNHFATLPEETKLEILNNQAKDPYNPDNWAFFEKQKKNFDTTYEGKTIQADIKTMQDDPVENIDIALNIGRDQVFQTIGAIGEWAGVSDGTFRKMAEKNSEWESVRFNQEMDANDNNILDSRFWTQKVPQSIPFMVALAPSQIAGAAAGGSIATVAGLGTLGKFLLQSGLAGLSSRMTESLAEGADTYATLVDNGATEEEASKRAWGTTKGNMALAFSDMTQMAVTFAPVGRLFPKIPGGSMTKFLVPAGKFVFDGASEGGEEVFQGYVQQYNVAKGLGQEPMSIFEYIQTPEALNAFSLGAASGMMFGGIGVAKDAIDNFTRRAEAQVDMVDSAVAKDDIDFIPKMEVLVQKDAIAQETVDAVKQLLELKVSEEKGITYDQWVEQGQNARAEKIGEIRGKLEEFSKSMKKKEVEQKQATYRETLQEVGMNEKEIENTLKIEREFGLDIEQSEFINEFVSKSTGEKFTYNTDLAGKYTEDIENSIKTAKEAYKNLKTVKENTPKSFEENLSKAVSDGKISERQKGYIKNEEDLKAAIENGNKVEELTGSRSITREKILSEEEQKTGAMVASIESLNIELENTINNSNSKEVVEKAKGKLEENKKKLEDIKNSKPTELEKKPTDLTKDKEVHSIPEKPENSKYTMEDISEKAFVVKGETMAIKEQLKEAGGKWMPKHKGWMFSKKRRAQVEEIIGQTTTKEDNIQNIPNISKNDSTTTVGTKTDRVSEKEPDTEVTSGRGDTGGEESGNGSRGAGTTSIGEQSKKVGKKGRAEINEKAKSILESKGYSTDAGEYSAEEIQVLRDYSGAGGKEATGATGRGLLDEYYTPREIVDLMWNLTEGEYIEAKTVLEPTAGVGRFIEGRSDKYEISGMEIDKVSGTIAQILNPEVSMEIGDFQKLFIDEAGKKKTPSKKYDIIIGNPPYGERSGMLKGLGEESKIGRQEEYFIKRGIDLLNEGGVLTFIIPSSFLQNGRSFAKEQIVANGGELIQSWRLPEGIFEDTTIGTDIVVIKKTGNGHVGDFTNDAYFQENPSNILGEIRTRKNRYGREENYVFGDRTEVRDYIKSMQELFKEIADKKRQEYEEYKEYINSGEGNVKQDAYSPALSKAFNDIQRIKYNVVRRDVLDKYDQIEQNASKNKLFQRFTDEAMEHISTMSDGMAATQSVQDLYYEMEGFAGPGGYIDYERNAKPRKKVEKTTPKTPEIVPDGKVSENKQTLQKTAKKKEIVQDIGGVPTVDRQILNDWGATEEEIQIFAATIQGGEVPYREEWKEYLNYYNGKYYHDINYFSGDVREKLDRLQEQSLNMTKEQYQKQKEGLEKVIPDDKTVQDISFDPLDRFITEFETGGEIRDWNNGNWRDVPKTIRHLFFSYLNNVPRQLLGHGVQKIDIQNYVNGDRARSDTKRIMGYIKSESKRFFNEFIKSSIDYELQQKIAEKYNREKNSYVRPKYDRIPVVVEGMAEEFRGKKFHLSETQKTGVGFLINKGSGLIAYGVGVGKTHTLAVATMANMQRGWSKRPLFIVPGSTLDKTWVKTLEQTFPGVKINNLEGLQAPVVRRLTAEQGADFTKWIQDGEISIVTHDGILKLGFKPDELFELTRDLNDALGNFDSNMTERQREKDRQKIEEELGKALRGQSEVSFTDLGFDHISVDEVHNFRKVFQGAKTEVDKDGEKRQGKRFANVVGGQPSTRARKLFLISQAVQKKSGGRGVFLASATPFENHATEVYNILSFMARDRLKALGIFNINDFFTAFANFQTEIVQKADGTFENKEVMKSFSNLPELQRLIQEFIDFKEDPTLVRPEKLVLTPQLKMSPKQEEVKEQILEMLRSEDDGVVLKATTYAKSNSVSPFFVKEFMGQPKDLNDFIENSPKIKYTLEMIRALKEDPKTAKRGNFIYIGKEGVGFTDYYIEYLTKVVGYKKSEIGVITGEVSIDAREEVKDKFNSGEIKVLIGGDPTKEGIDLQENGYATFNVALGWNPTEMAQVEGRVWRQGNKANQVLMVYPLVENSGDVNIYQKFEEKAGRINDLFSYSEGNNIFDVGELDPKEKKLMLLTDPGQKANLSIMIDSEKLSGELIYMKGTLDDIQKMKDDFEGSKKAIEEQKARLEITTDESRKETIKKDIQKYQQKVTGIKKKLHDKGIDSFDKEMERIQVKIAELETKVSEVKLQYAPLLEKYTKEQQESIARTKSIDDHKKDILEKTKNLFFKSDEELRIEKEKKIEEADKKLEEKRKTQDDTNDSWIYDIIGEKYTIKPFAREKIDISEAYTEAIQLAPKGWTVMAEDPTKENFLIKENGDEVVAYADLEKKIIMLSKKEVRKTTAAHESVHAALSELPDNKRKEVLNASKRQWEEYTGRKLSEEQSEEFLAEEFKYYIENQKYKTKTLVGKIREFLSRLVNRIKGVFGKDDKIKAFYESILAGAEVSAQTRTGKKFQSYDKRTQEMYDDIDAENFGYKLPPKLGAKYELNMEKEKMPSETWQSFKDFSSTILVPIDTIIGNIDKGLKDRLWKFEYGVANSQIMQEARPILKRFQDKLQSKKEDPDYRILDLALKNGDGEVVEYYAEKLGVLEELKDARAVLDMIYKDATEVGIDMKYVETYFPRTVRDSKGLLTYLNKTEYGSQILEAIKLSENAKGHDLTDDEKAAIANKLLRGFKIEGIKLTPPGNAKARTIEEVNKEINPFYNDSMDSLAMYIQGMNENIEARKLFGKGDNLESSIGAFTMQLLKEGKITPVQELNLTKALRSRFSQSKMWAFLQGYRNLAYMTTMGSPISAISQIQDLAFSLYENGFMRSGGAWIRSVFRKSEISRDDLGISNIIHEFTDPTKTQAALAKIFKWVGLEYMDKVGKETLVNGYLVKLREAVAKGDMKDLDIFSPEEQTQIAKDLAEGKISEEIRYILFAKLMQYQPITRSQMPQYYNESANGRMFYMLKTYMIKQIDVFRQEAFKDIAEGSRTKNKAQVVKGFKNLIHLTIALMLMGGLTDLIKNLILNRPIDPTDLVIDNILKLMGFSKYTVYKVKEGSLSEGILSVITPPFNFINDVIVDAYDIAEGKMEAPDKLQSINNIPVGGKLYYWWFGKGDTKSNKKREKMEKAGQVKIKTTTKKSPFSQDLNFSDNSKAFKQTLNFK